jgi:hypothetical protein
LSTSQGFCSNFTGTLTSNRVPARRIAFLPKQIALRLVGEIGQPDRQVRGAQLPPDGDLYPHHSVFSIRPTGTVFANGGQEGWRVTSLHPPDIPNHSETRRDLHPGHHPGRSTDNRQSVPVPPHSMGVHTPGTALLYPTQWKRTQFADPNAPPSSQNV